MSDKFIFGNVPKHISIKKVNDIIDNPILYEYGETNKDTIYFIIEKPLSENKIKSIALFLKNRFGNISYKIISSVITEISDTEETKAIVKLYAKNRCDLDKYIPEHSKVVISSRAIFALLESDDVMINYFYDDIFNKPYFYSPEIKSYVFPIDSFSLTVLTAKDNYERTFLLNQIDRCIKFDNTYNRIPKLELIDLQKKDEVNDLLSMHLNKDEKIAYDLETSGFNFITDEILCLTLSFTGYAGYHLDWENINKKLLNDFFNKKYTIANNGKFDNKFLRRNDINSFYLNEDNLNLGHILNEMRSNSLKTQSYLYTPYGGYEKDLEKYKESYLIKSYKDIPRNIRMPYAITDSCESYLANIEMNKQLKEIDNKFPMCNNWSLYRVYHEIVMPSVNVSEDYEFEGVKINIDELNKQYLLVSNKIREKELEVYKAFNIPIDSINLHSSAQLGNLIKQKGWNIYSVGKNGIPSVDKEALKRWAIEDKHPEAKILLEIATLDTLADTFLGQEKDEKGKPTGIYKNLIYHSEDNSYRAHSRYASMLKVSLRGGSSDPNLQNIPARGEKASIVRKIFMPPSSDYVFASTDFSGLQMYIVAMQSKCEVMKDIILNYGGDFHSKTGASILLNNKISFGDFLKEKKTTYKEQRRKAKGINFGEVFGAQPSTLKRNTIDDPEDGWSDEEIMQFIKENNLHLIRNEDSNKPDYGLTVATELAKRFFETYPGIPKWHEANKFFAKHNGYIRSMHSIIRRLPELRYQNIANANFKNISNLNNISLNSPTQAVESVIVQRWLKKFKRYIKNNNMKSVIFGYIHDAGEKFIYKNELVEACTASKAIAELYYPEYNGIKILVEGNISDYYGTMNTENWELWDLGHDWSKYLDDKIYQKIQKEEYLLIEQEEEYWRNFYIDYLKDANVKNIYNCSI